jgi:hypothetical protein
LGGVKERDHSEDLGIDGRIKLKWILRKYGKTVWTGFVTFWVKWQAV